jgi:hypothetical protein
MTTKEISGFLSAGLCIAVLLIAGLPGTVAAEQNYNNLYSSNSPQTAQEREALFRAIQSADEKSVQQSAQNVTDLYKALQNPFATTDPQAALELANTYKELQKYNAAYSSSRNDDNWYYWTNMWLNGAQEATGSDHAIIGSGAALDLAKVYGTMSNPFAYKDPQSALELANTYKELQKYNAAYSSSRNNDNWEYWTNMWLNGA